MASREDHLLALGRVVVAASMMDLQLMAAYAALRGTDNAAAEAAGRMTSWLIRECAKLTEAHAAITAEGKDGILAVLEACRLVSLERNRLVHDAWAFESGDLDRMVRDGRPSEYRLVTIQSQENTYTFQLRHWDVDEIDVVANRIRAAYRELGEPIVSALGVKSWGLGWKFHQENQADVPNHLMLDY